MFNHRKLWLALAFATLFLLLPEVFHAAESPGATQEDLLYRAYSDYHFFKRGIEYDREMAIRESFLKWLYDGVVGEVLLRRKEDPHGTLDALSPPELLTLGESIPLSVDNLRQLLPYERFIAVTEFTREEYNRKYLKARMIKDRLIRSATATQRQRMFQADLQTTLYSYLDKYYSEAILQFNEIIQSYGYKNVEDVVFYRGECYFALQLYPKAEADYQVVINGSVSPTIRLKALMRLLVLAGDDGNLEALNRYWNIIESEYAESQREDYWASAYLCGRYLMFAGELERARAIFDIIPPGSSDFFQARLYAAECSLSLVDLVEAEARFEALSLPESREDKIPEAIRNTSLLKLGYVQYLKGDYDLAFVNFTKIRMDGCLRERANIGSAWSLYHLKMSDQARKLVTQFINDFPNSEYLYEAQALQGFCDELCGNDTLALGKYERILTAMDDRQEYRDFNYERNEIIRIVSALTDLESAIFEYGRRDLFPQYLEFRKSLMELAQKIRLAEGYKTSPRLMEMITEQAQLRKTIEEQADLEAELYQREEGKLVSKLEKVYVNLLELTDKVDAGIRYELSKNNLIQREEKKRFTDTRLDTLNKAMRFEFQSLEQIRTEVGRQKEAAVESGDQLVYAELSGLELELQILQNQLSYVEKDLRQRQAPPINSDLDIWSDFAYQRRQFGGLAFDEFYARQNRVDQLDQYIQRVNQLLSKRQKDDQTTQTLAENLVPVSTLGAKEHFAPPLPLWRPHALDEALRQALKSKPETEEKTPVPLESSDIKDAVAPSTPEAVPSETIEPPAEPTEPIQEAPEKGADPQDEPTQPSDPDAGSQSSEPMPAAPSDSDANPQNDTGENPNQEDTQQQ